MFKGLLIQRVFAPPPPTKLRWRSLKNHYRKTIGIIGITPLSTTGRRPRQPNTPPNFFPFSPASRPICFDSSPSITKAIDLKMSSQQKIAIVSVYDKTGLLDLAKGLVQQNVRILASGGTSKMIRESGFPVEYV